MRRYLMAAGTSCLVIVLVYLCYREGILDQTGFLQIASAIIFWVGFFYVIFRTQLNLKFSDPSLTLPQMTVATLTMLYAMYLANGGRAVFALAIVMTFLFGVLRLTTRVLLFFVVFVLVAYVAIVGLVSRLRPGTVDVSFELLQWLVLCLTLPWFAAMGGHVSRLREQSVRDNAELRRALESTATSEAELADAQRIARLGTWSFDPIRQVARWSSETYSIYGVDASSPAPVGEAFIRLVHDDDRTQYQELIAAALQHGRPFDSQFRVVSPNREPRFVHAVGQPTVDSSGRTTLLRGTVVDITPRVSEEKLRQLAHFDKLTGLPNRNLFTELLAHSLAQAERHKALVALFFIDLDGYKAVNDPYGHDAGDRLLDTFAQRLRDSLRKSDATVRLEVGTAARLGGDEFVVLIDDFSQQPDLEVVANKILLLAAQPYHDGHHQMHVTASIGIAIYPQDAEDAAHLIKQADAAMYVAKQAGKNLFRFASA